MKINKTHNQQWFTLIELLVVITIIGILATSGVGIYTTQMQWARDSVRVQNMKLLETSLHQYYADKWKYPEIAESATDVSSELVTAIQVYNSNYPKDPKAWVPTCWQQDVSKQDKECAAYYREEADGNGLPHSAFKVASTLEKETNVSESGISRTDGWSINGFFEVFWGKWGSGIEYTELIKRRVQ